MSNKFKLLFVGPFPPPYGGIANHTNLLFNSKLRQEFELYKLNINLPEEKTEVISEQKKVNFKKIIRLVSSLIRIIKNNNPDLYYIKMNGNISCFREYFLMLIIRHFTKSKIVLHFHGMFKEYQKNFPFIKKQNQNKVNKFIINKIFSKPDKVVFLSEYLLREFSPILCINNIKKSTFVDHFIKPDMIFQNKNKSNSTINILFMGRLSKAKGFFDLLSIIPELFDINKNICFHICGAKELADSLINVQENINQLTLQGVVKMHGIVTGEKKKQILAKSDILAFPSYTEIFPNTVLECLGAGISIVATRVGVIPYIIEEGINGFLIDPGDVSLLKARIIDLMNNRSLRDEIYINNITKAKEKFDISLAENKMSSIFQEVLKTKND